MLAKGIPTLMLTPCPSHFLFGESTNQEATPTYAYGSQFGQHSQVVFQLPRGIVPFLCGSQNKSKPKEIVKKWLI